jgi:hypothetical protein
LFGDGRSDDWLRRSPLPDLPIAGNWILLANGACAMQTGPCGHRLGISRSFRETLATGFPNMQQPCPQGRRCSQKFRENTF